MYEQFLNYMVRWRWLVLVFFLLVMGLSAAGIPRIAVLSDYKAFVDPEYPALLELDAIEEIFTENHNLLIAVAPNNGDVFTAFNLTLLQSLTDEAWLLPHASRIDSITNFQHTEVNNDDLNVGDLIPSHQTITPEIINRGRRVANDEPSLNSVLISARQHVAVVSVTFEIPDELGSSAAYKDVLLAANTLIDEYRSRYPEVTFYVTGMATVNYALGKYAVQDSAGLIPAMLVLMAIILWLASRSFSAVISTVAVVILTGIGTMGMLGWWGWVIDSTSAIAPVVIMTLAVADSIHIIAGMQMAMQQGLNKQAALRQSLKDNFAPVFLTSLTTMLGVSTFAFSDFPSLRRLGVSVAIGVGVAFILSITLLPVMLSMLPVRAKIKRRERNIFPYIAHISICHPIKIVVLALLLSVSLLPLIPLNSFNDAPNAMLSAFTPERKAVEFYEENVSGILQMEVAIFTDQAGAINNPAFLQKAEQFADWLRAQPEVDQVNTITDTFKRLNKNMHGDDPAWYRLPDRQDLAAQYLLLYEMSLPYGLALNNQINIDKSAIRMTAIFNQGDSQKLYEGKQKIERWFAQNATQLRVIVTGTTPLMAELSYIHLIPSMVKGGSIAVLMVSLVLFFALRSPMLGGLGMLANVLPIAMGYGLWYLINGKVSFAVASVAGVCLGVVVDFAVHFLSKYQLGRRQGKDNEQAILFSFAKTGWPLTITAVVLIGGFWLLMLSPVSLNAEMGRLTGIIIIFALVFDFFVLPALLTLLARIQGR